MAIAKTHYLPDVASYAIRPALAEAKLITQKHAGDAVYVATLTEELRAIEARIAAAEEAVHLGSSAAPVELRPRRAPEDMPDANWIRAKSRVLGLRLRRIEIARSTKLSLEPVSSDASPSRMPH